MKNSWKKEVFEECIEPVTYTQKIQRKDFLDEGAYPIISQEEAFINGYWDNEDDLFKVSTPVIVFGDHTKVLKYVDFDFVLGADGVKILHPRDFLLPKFFYYQVQSANLDSLGYARHYKLLKELEIVFPDRPEQQRIVRVLDGAFEGIDTAKTNAEKNLQNVSELFNNYLQSVFTSKSKGWEIKKLADVAEYFNGLTYSPKDVSSKGIIVLRSSNIQNGELDFSDIVRVSCPVREKVMVKDGDILMCSRNGSKRLVGKTAGIRNLSEVMTFGTFMMIIRSQYNSYLTWFFKSSEFRAQISRGGNTMINQITRYMLDDISVSFPPPREQEAIVKKMAALSIETQRLESIYRQKLSALDELKKSLLHQAFIGQL